MVYDPYKVGGPEERRQRQMNQVATSPIRAAADSGALAPARMALNNIVKPAAQAIARPVVEGRERQTQYMGREAAKKIRPVPDVLRPNYQPPQQTVSPQPQTQAYLPPPGGVVSRPAPQPNIRQLRTEGGTMSINYTDNDLAIKRNMEQINSLLASGVQPTAEQSARIASLRERAGFLRGGTDRVPVGQNGLPLPREARGTQRVGNMDVTFDPSVGAAQRRAFMENPVRPTAQIDRFNSMRGQDAGQGQRAAMNADMIVGGTPQISNDSELLTRQNSSMGWKARKELNQQILSNRQSGNNAALQANTAMAENMNRLSIAKMGENTARERNAIDRFNVAGTLANSSERNEIDRMNATGAEKERAANISAKNMETAQAQKLYDLQDAYRAEKDPAKKKTLENELYAIQGKQQPKYQVVTRKGVGPDGYTPTETPYLVDADGNAKTIGGDEMDFGNPSEATIQYLKNLKATNPKEYEKIRDRWRSVNASGM